MIKYVILAFTVYYIYTHYFSPVKKIISNKSENKQTRENKTEDEYVDYEEVE